MSRLRTRTEPTPARRPRPLTAAALGLPRDARAVGRRDGLGPHVRATLDAQVRVLLAEQESAGRADEPESVHQMRVATRRMRVALRLGRAPLGAVVDELRAELGWLAALLGGVRDLDVLCERLGEDATTLPEPDLPAFAEVLSALMAVRGTAAGALTAQLHAPRYRALLRALAVQARVEDGPALDGAEPDPAALVRKPLRAVHQQLVASTQSPSDESWHTLRIRVKRVRYAAEVALRLAGRKHGAGLAELASAAKGVQEVLGTFQDTVAAEEHLRSLVTARAGGLSPAAVLVVGRLVERQDAHRARLRPTLPAACGELYRLSADPA